MRAIIFGAGNIGRGFLAELLQENNYHITFIDVNDDVISRLQKEKTYDITYIETGKTITINNFEAINSKTHFEDAKKAIQNADLILTAVGVKVLPFLNDLLSKAINEDHKIKKSIIACENALRATSQWKASLWDLFTTEAKASVQMIDAVVDRIVPGGNTQSLNVNVEQYKSLVIDKNQVAFELKLKNIDTPSNLDAYIERKIYLVNSLHALIAWEGLNRNIQYIHESLALDEVRKNVLNLAKELMDVLEQKFTFNRADLEKYTLEVIKRFENSKLNDLCSRVGAGVLRKLSFNDRLITPFRFAYEHNLETKNIVRTINVALNVKNEKDLEVTKRDEILKSKSNAEALHEITGLEVNVINKYF